MKLNDILLILVAAPFVIFCQHLCRKRLTRRGSQNLPSVLDKHAEQALRNVQDKRARLHKSQSDQSLRRETVPPRLFLAKPTQSVSVSIRGVGYRVHIAWPRHDV